MIIDDISRLARGLEAHIMLRAEIGAAGGRLESPSIEFGHDSDSRLVEHLLASVSQHARQKNAEQVVSRMRARIMNGRWPFRNPAGYYYAESEGNGKVLLRDEPHAEVIKAAYEGLASGRFQSVAEVKRFIEGYPTFPLLRKGEIHFQRVKDILSRPIYALIRDEGKVLVEPGGIEPPTS